MKNLWASLSMPAISCVFTSKYTGKPMVTNDEDGLRKRAAFELSCEPEALEVIALEGGPNMGPWTAGVSGCGKKVVYKFVMDAGWVANTAISAQ